MHLEDAQHDVSAKSFPWYVLAALFIFIAVVLYDVSRYNFLLFHSLVEGFGVVVAFSIFVLAWNSRKIINNDYLLLAGIGYLFVAIIDFLHTLAYPGMGVFAESSTNLSAQLWIAGRYIQSLSLLAAPLFVKRKLEVRSAFAVYTLAVILLLASIFYWHNFPPSFIEGTGLTPFKVASEYVISFFMLGAIGGIYRQRGQFNRTVYLFLVASMATAILSEMSSTLYSDPFGATNALGHLLMLLSFYFVYRAIIMTGLIKPFDLLFFNLKQSERRLQTANESLEDRVKARTGELAEEVTRRKLAEERTLRLNSVLNALRNINQVMVQEKDRQALIEQCTKILIESPCYHLAWILLVDEKRDFLAAAVAGPGKSVVSNLTPRFKRGEYLQCAREALAWERPTVTVYDDVQQKHLGCPLAGSHTGGAALTSLLQYEGKILGTITVGVTRDTAMDTEERGMFRELASDISFGLANIEKEELRLKANRELAGSENKFRSLVNNISLGIFRCSRGEEGIFMEVNPAMEKITGYSRIELLDSKVPRLYANAGDRKEVLRKVETVTSSFRQEAKFKKKDGSEIIVAETTVPVRDANGTVMYFDGIIEDITQSTMLHEQLMASDRLATIGQLVSGVAHEMNNPLTSVVGFSEILLGKELPADVREDLTIINKEALRTSEIVKGLLTFARKKGTEKVPVGLSAIIQDVLKIRAYDQKLKNIQVVTQFASDLPAINGNSGQLQQVFINLIVNAEQAILEVRRKGTITIATEKADGTVRARITDDGPGIPPENMPKLFTPFFTTKEKGKGTGLGLSICHGIITEHGGRIWASSHPDNGATITIELPVLKSG